MLELTDSYKLSHKGFMTEGTEEIYSNATARSDKYFPDGDGTFVVFGLQHTIKEMLIRKFNDEFFNLPKEQVISKFKRLCDAYLGLNAVSMHHFEELHDLGYLPIHIKALAEGTVAPIKTPFLTIRNTHPRFAWLTNYLETIISCETWKAMTVATIARQYRKLVNEWALKTTGSTAGTEFQVHDFSFRGMSNHQDSAKCGAAFLLSTNGTDNIPALPFLEEFYGADLEKEFVATSVPASEHSLASTGIAVNGELETYRKWITQDYPTGIVSIISDTTDFFRVVTEFALELKDDILNRQPNELGLAKCVFRPDSGDPVKILTGYVTDGIDFKTKWQCYLEYDYCSTSLPEAVKIAGKYYELQTAPDGRVVLGNELSEAEVKGAVECLYDIFGGTKTEQGFIQLHERVGLIYGDSITIPRAKEILRRLAKKGFASTNVVLGVGSYTCQYITRDTLGIAVKATSAVVNGQRYDLFKDPKTDDGIKRSAKGLLRVDENLVTHDQQTEEQEAEGLLETVFLDGTLTKDQTFQQIKEKLWNLA